MPHDHPRGFLTIVLRGGYDDLVPCPTCRGTRDALLDPGASSEQRLIYGPCARCSGLGLVVGDRLRAPAIRRRRAEHAHMTRTGNDGALTLVVMGPEVRPWGFWREGRWWAFREFERVFGFTWRCEEPDPNVKAGTDA